MSDWLVHIEVSLPPDVDAAVRADLLDRERQESHRLQRAGVLVRIWREPGRTASWSIWSAADATSLHAALMGLPVSPWMSIVVHPLARHPNDLHDSEV